MTSTDVIYYSSSPDDDVSVEFLCYAMAYLDCAEVLNDQIADGNLHSDAYRAQVILYLTFHATETFLKGCLLRSDGNQKFHHHSVGELLSKLLKMFPSIELDAPVCVAPSDFVDEETMQATTEFERRLHERFRYPADTRNLVWSRAGSFSALAFRSDLKKFRAQMKEAERIISGSKLAEGS